MDESVNKTVSMSADPEKAFNDADGKFLVLSIAIGQGECTVIRCPDGKIGMIDCGTKKDYFTTKPTGAEPEQGEKKIYFTPEKLNALLKSMTKRVQSGNTTLNNYELDFVILTHCDEDHYNQLDGVLKGTTVKRLYYSAGLNVMSDDCKFTNDENIEYKPSPSLDTSLNWVEQMMNYSGIYAFTFFINEFNIEEIIEPVINSEVQQKFTYSYVKTEDKKDSYWRGNNNDQLFGEREDLGNKAIEKERGREIVVKGSSEIIGDWEIAIIAGNIVYTKEENKLICGTSGSSKGRTSNRAKVADDEGEFDPDNYDFFGGKKYNSDGTIAKKQRTEEPEPAELLELSDSSKELISEKSIIKRDDITDEIEIKRFVPPGGYTRSKNSYAANTASLVTQLSFENKTALFMGDATNITFSELNYILNDTVDSEDGDEEGIEAKECVLSNIPHHGSRAYCNDVFPNNHENDANFLEKINPKLSFFSAGYRNSHRLPRSSAINNYKNETLGNDNNNNGMVDVWITSNKTDLDAKKKSWEDANLTIIEKEGKDVYKDTNKPIISYELANIPEEGGVYLLDYSHNDMLERKVNIPGVISVTKDYYSLKTDELNYLEVTLPFENTENT